MDIGSLGEAGRGDGTSEALRLLSLAGRSIWAAPIGGGPSRMGEARSRAKAMRWGPFDAPSNSCNRFATAIVRNFGVFAA